jgi:hypothetical protein
MKAGATPGLVALAALVLAGGASAATKERGTFTTLADGSDGPHPGGGGPDQAHGERHDREGARPRPRARDHLRRAPPQCSLLRPEPGRRALSRPPGRPAAPPSELWLSSTEGPTAGITSNPAGVAQGRGGAEWVARPEARSVVIHFIPPGGTIAGGPKIACADLG